MTFSFAEEIRRYPFIRLTIPLIVGIVLTLLLPMPQWVGWSLLGLSAVCFVVFKHMPKYNIALATGISVNVFLIATGFLLASFNVEGEAKDTLAGYKGFVIGEVADDPKIKENNVSIEINVSAIRDGDEWLETSGRTLLYLEKDSASMLLRTGDRIVFRRLSKKRQSLFFMPQVFPVLKNGQHSQVLIKSPVLPFLRVEFYNNGQKRRF